MNKVNNDFIVFANFFVTDIIVLFYELQNTPVCHWSDKHTFISQCCCFRQVAMMKQTDQCFESTTEFTECLHF